jgi:hypothetical protein
MTFRKADNPMDWMLPLMKVIAVVIFLACISFGQSTVKPKEQGLRIKTMDEIYGDEGHCLTLPEIRSDKDDPISCYCRDAIAEARYVYFTYLLTGKDRNLNGAFLALYEIANQKCGHDVIGESSENKDWKWDGPEVVRTYPSDDVIERITPEKSEGKATGRWVPFTVQLIYRDGLGHVIRTDNYSSREFEPVSRK